MTTFYKWDKALCSAWLISSVHRSRLLTKCQNSYSKPWKWFAQLSLIQDRQRKHSHQVGYIQGAGRESMSLINKCVNFSTNEKLFVVLPFINGLKTTLNPNLKASCERNLPEEATWFPSPFWIMMNNQLIISPKTLWVELFLFSAHLFLKHLDDSFWGIDGSCRPPVNKSNITGWMTGHIQASSFLLPRLFPPQAHQSAL